MLAAQKRERLDVLYVESFQKFKKILCTVYTHHFFNCSIINDQIEPYCSSTALSVPPSFRFLGLLKIRRIFWGEWERNGTKRQKNRVWRFLVLTFFFSFVFRLLFFPKGESEWSERYFVTVWWHFDWSTEREKVSFLIDWQCERKWLIGRLFYNYFIYATHLTVHTKENLNDDESQHYRWSTPTRRMNVTY